MNIKFSTKLWLNKVFKKVGTEPFVVSELGKEFDVRGAPQNAHILGHIDRVGKVRGNRSKWQINQATIEKWYNPELV